MITLSIILFILALLFVPGVAQLIFGIILFAIEVAFLLGMCVLIYVAIGAVI